MTRVIHNFTFVDASTLLLARNLIERYQSHVRKSCDRSFQNSKNLGSKRFHVFSEGFKVLFFWQRFLLKESSGKTFFKRDQWMSQFFDQ
jgi:hypothetical protein